MTPEEIKELINEEIKTKLSVRFEKDRNGNYAEITIRILYDGEYVTSHSFYISK